MNTWLDDLDQAVRALIAHRLRTALSVLGITIGIAAVMAVATVSRGGNYLVYSELETFGLRTAWIYRDWNATPPGQPVRAGSGIDADDVAAIASKAEALGISRLSPLVYLDDRPVISRGNRVTNAELTGVSLDYSGIVDDRLVDGRYFHSSDVQRRHAVALLGPDVASRLFPPGSAVVGETFRIDGKRFQVIGLLERKSRDFLASIGASDGQEVNDRILIPWTTMLSVRTDDEVDTLQIEVAVADEAEDVTDAVVRLLTQRNRGRYDYEGETMGSYIDTADNILGGVALIGIIAASISLLVGGMGIANMMSTAVLERTREIGVRKAIGARESDILRQFLLEAVLIALIGGSLGLAIGALSSVILATVTDLPLIPSPVAIGVALAVSVLVGILAGYLPARRAARLHPVEALRAS